uniref:Actin cortical patch SUR7/pH-response regulator pali n=1 Tax=Rhabditophanes sp. KR3021 TaxID=114890 RepID=A0AC35U6V1_9BILA
MMHFISTKIDYIYGILVREMENVPYYRLTLKFGNFLASFSCLVAAIFVALAISSREWIITNRGNNTYSDDLARDYMAKIIRSKYSQDTIIPYFDSPTAKCDKLGARNFWANLQFGQFEDDSNKTHITVRFDDYNLSIDCLSQVIASIFYCQIALCFAVFSMIAVNSAVYIVYPTSGFVHWLITNCILDLCSFMLLGCIILMCSYTKKEIHELQSHTNSDFGVGYTYLIAALVFCLLSIFFGVRKICHDKSSQRQDNQRILCSCTLRSMRDIYPNPPSGHSADHYERYLLNRRTEELDTVTLASYLSEDRMDECRRMSHQSSH